MSNAEVLGAVLGVGAVAYVATRPKVATPPSSASGPTVMGSKFTLSSSAVQRVIAKKAAGAPKGFAVVSGSSNKTTFSKYTAIKNLGSGKNAPNANAALDYVRGKLKEEYDKLTAAAKKKGAELLNEEFPGLNMTGNETFEQASEKIGSQLGGEGAAAACTAYPPTSAAAPLCGILGKFAGKYLGRELGPYLRDAWNKVEEWAGDAYESVEDAARDVGSAVEDAVGSLKFW